MDDAYRYDWKSCLALLLLLVGLLYLVGPTEATHSSSPPVVTREVRSK